MSDRDLLLKVFDYADRLISTKDEWHKGPYLALDNKNHSIAPENMCAAKWSIKGAIMAAYKWLPLEEQAAIFTRKIPIYQILDLLCSRVVTEKLKKESKSKIKNIIQIGSVAFNEMPETTFEDIKLVFSLVKQDKIGYEIF